MKTQSLTDTDLQKYFESANFETSATTLKQCPNDKSLEVAFAGRSNAGKSSAINCLCNKKKLARVSKTPGRTQLINFFLFKRQTKTCGSAWVWVCKSLTEKKINLARTSHDILRAKTGLTGFNSCNGCSSPATTV